MTFEEALKKKRVLTKFKKSYNKFCKEHREPDFMNLKDTLAGDKNFICIAFSWRESKEGVEFWRDMDEEITKLMDGNQDV